MSRSSRPQKYPVDSQVNLRTKGAGASNWVDNKPFRALMELHHLSFSHNGTGPLCIWVDSFGGTWPMYASGLTTIFCDGGPDVIDGKIDAEWIVVKRGGSAYGIEVNGT